MSLYVVLYVTFLAKSELRETTSGNVAEKQIWTEK